MKSAITFVTLGLALLAGCNNQPIGMAITLNSQQVTPQQRDEVVQSGRVDPSLPIASTVFITKTHAPDPVEIGSQDQPCLSVAACD